MKHFGIKLMLVVMTLGFCVVYGMITVNHGTGKMKEIKVPENQRAISLTIPTSLPTSTHNVNGESALERMKQLEKKGKSESNPISDHLSNSISTVAKKGMNVASSTVNLISQLFL
ncbi:hypothetical protein [Terrilactibacillus laevilacticus]|uniref:DUF3679 domain-containing protein n=1 Tax=Terrilactibacillus laevilacticus TaxID=1380157 RepID=A0ABW5PUD0_9BACI|nr:hypothetical protein [Terrilactibacillus laevilacticus]